LPDDLQGRNPTARKRFVIILCDAPAEGTEVVSISTAFERQPRSEPENVTSDRGELVAAFEQNRDRLLRLIATRLDRRLAGRVDPSDIFQETFLRANAAFDEFCRLSEMPVYNWLRIQVQFAVGDCHRTHLGTMKRAVGMEHHSPGDTVLRVFEELAESMVSPASQIANADLAEQIREMIASMPEMDREILQLRHVEEMTVSEAAAELGISVEAAKKRHLRAIRRLQELCDGLNGSSIG